jgi:hypothetical protein
MFSHDRFKNGTRSSLTFSNQRVEEIERENKHLLDKIMRNGPGGDGFVSPSPSTSSSKRKGFSFNVSDDFGFYSKIKSQISKIKN